MAVEILRSTLRINVSLGLVIVSLIAELLFVVLLSYSLYRLL
jgi:hypothetical protein